MPHNRAYTPIHADGEKPASRVYQLDKPSTGNPGYGFDLLMQEGGVYIGRTGIGMPAMMAGIRSGMKVLAVNGEDMSGAGKDTVGRAIKLDPWHVTLTLVDEPETPVTTTPFPKVSTSTEAA